MSANAPLQRQNLNTKKHMPQKKISETIHYTYTTLQKKTIEIKKVNLRQNYSATALLLHNAKGTTTVKAKPKRLNNTKGVKLKRKKKK